jgi:hypothetical protein
VTSPEGQPPGGISAALVPERVLARLLEPVELTGAPRMPNARTRAAARPCSACSRAPCSGRWWLVVLLQGFGLPVFSGLWAALPAAGLTGALAGLSTGRPNLVPGERASRRAQGARRDALGRGAAAARAAPSCPSRWCCPADLGHCPIGNLPATALPLVAPPPAGGVLRARRHRRTAPCRPAAKAGVPRAGTAAGSGDCAARSRCRGRRRRRRRHRGFAPRANVRWHPGRPRS